MTLRPRNRIGGTARRRRGETAVRLSVTYEFALAHLTEDRIAIEQSSNCIIIIHYLYDYGQFLHPGIARMTGWRNGATQNRVNKKWT